jgi:hypothetical protein
MDRPHPAEPAANRAPAELKTVRDSASIAPVYDTPLTPEQLLPRLAAAPARIATLTEGLAPAELRAPPAEGGWSAADVLAHLRACADVWGGCIARLLAEDRPAFRAVNPTTWIKQTNYRDLAFGPSLRAYPDQRAGLLAVLERLPPEEWSRAATVTGVGRAFERTVLTYARWLANHERSHDRQFARVADAARGPRAAGRSEAVPGD